MRRAFDRCEDGGICFQRSQKSVGPRVSDCSKEVPIREDSTV